MPSLKQPYLVFVPPTHHILSPSSVVCIHKDNHRLIMVRAKTFAKESLSVSESLIAMHVKTIR